MKSSKKGFTLIELMIVVAIIGILAAVAIPKFAEMLEKAREGATKGNIGAIKSAVSIYYGDTEGNWPSHLTGATTSFGKYMDAMPPVKLTHKGVKDTANASHTWILSGTSTVVTLSTVDTFGIVPSAGDDGWRYNNLTGNVWVNNGQRDTKLEYYTLYGY